EIVRRILAVIIARVIKVPARANVAAHEFGLGEAEVDLLTDRPPFQARHYVLPAPPEVPLRYAQVDDEGIHRTEPGSHGQLSGGLFGHLDGHHTAVRLAAPHFLDGDVLEEAQGAQIVARPLDQRAVKGIALHQHHLAPDDRVDGPRVAHDVDALDIDPLALADVEGHVHCACL